MKVMVLLAEGFEEVEALTVVDYLRRMDIGADMVSVTDDRNVKGAHGVEVVTDKELEDLDLSQYEGIVIPGGLPGAENLKKNSKVIEAVREFNHDKRLVAAICAGPIVLEEAGILEGNDYTCYPGFEKVIKQGNHKEENVVRDGNIITSRGPALAGDFAIEIVNFIAGKETKEALMKDIVYKK